MTPDQLSYFEAKLLTLQEECLGVSDLVAGDVSMLNQLGARPVSRAEAMQQPNQVQGDEVNRDNQLLNLKEALERIDDGQYGCCEKCLQAISDASLELNPAIKYCAKCVAL